MKIYVERLFSEQKPTESGYYFTRYQTGKLWSDEGVDFYDSTKEIFETDCCYTWLEEIEFPKEKQIVELAHNRFMTSEYISPEASKIYQICYQNCWEWIKNYIKAL